MTTRSKRKKPAVGGGGLAVRDRATNPSPCAHYNLVGISCQGTPRTPVRAGGKVVGRVQGDTFRKSVRASIHQLRTPRAWALDVASLDAAERAGAVRVEIRDVESGLAYVADIALIRAKGFEFDRGHGRQIGLALELWDCQRPEPAARQLALVGVGDGE